MTKEIKNFSEYFVKELGMFVKNMKVNGIKTNLTKTELNAVITETFYLLGRNHKEWKVKAGIK